MQQKVSRLALPVLALIVMATIECSTSFAQEMHRPPEVSSDTLLTPHQAYMFIRGIEQDAHSGTTPLRSIWGVVSFIPSQIGYGLRYASGYGARLINDPRFIETLEELFFTDDRTFGWYPILDITSGFRPRVGINLLYSHGELNTVAKAAYSDTDKYKIKAQISYRFRTGNSIWRLTLSGISEYEDDREFYGIGANPTTDERSHFLPEAAHSYGVYFQRRWQALMVLGVRPFPNWEWFLTSYYQRRQVADPSIDDTSIGRIFDLESLPGVEHSMRQIYSEISTRLDTRDDNLYVSGGIKLEGYVGMVRGLGGNRSRLLRAGSDLACNIPIIQQNRVFTPRVVFDMIENLDDNVPIPFTEYPRQPSFRGVSRRKILRADNYSLVPSIEYQWPLSSNLHAHVFLDYLLVAHEPAKFSFKKAPWAAGFAIDLHVIDGELGRMQFAAGSEGLRFTLSVGIDPLLSDRTNWE